MPFHIECFILGEHVLILNQTCKQCLCEVFETLNSLLGGSMFAAGRRGAIQACVGWRQQRSQLLCRHREVCHVSSVPKSELRISIE